MGVCFAKEQNMRQPVRAATIRASSIGEISVVLDSKTYPDIRKFYRFDKVIGNGHFGTVRKATKIGGTTTESNVAVKSINKEKVGEGLKFLKRELEFLRTVTHPNIVKYYEVYEDDRYLHIVMELCTGGDLLDHVLRGVSFSEQEAVRILRKLCSAVKYLHCINICHRDLKPDNFLYTTKEPGAEIKIIDFGLATKFGMADQADAELHSVVGSPYFIAPEVLRGKYGQECDVWSLGVIIYTLLFGEPPFTGASRRDIFKQILKSPVEFPHDHEVSLPACELITLMMVKKPSERISLDDAMRHEWLQQDDSILKPIPYSVFDKLKRYQSPSLFRKEAMKLMINQISSEQINELKEAFISLDADNSGFISIGEVEEAMRLSGLSFAAEQIAKVTSNLMISTEGKLNYSEFIMATVDKKQLFDDEKLHATFKYFDLVRTRQDNSGYIHDTDIVSILSKSGIEVTLEQAREMIGEYTEDASLLDFRGFREMLMNPSMPNSPLKVVASDQARNSPFGIKPTKIE
jgi:calcium-dependent protein kinase